MMIIDPPVNSLSPRDDIISWMRQLRRLRESATSLARVYVDEALAQAQHWLDNADDTGNRG